MFFEDLIELDSIYKKIRCFKNLMYSFYTYICQNINDFLLKLKFQNLKALFEERSFVSMYNCLLLFYCIPKSSFGSYVDFV